MNTEIKVSLSINLQGSTLVRRSKKDTIKVVKEYVDKYTRKVTTKEYYLSHQGYDIKPATQHLDIYKDTYDYMVSGECPSFVKPKDWTRMSKKLRLEAHLQNICDELMGIGYTYELLND